MKKQNNQQPQPVIDTADDQPQTTSQPVSTENPPKGSKAATIAAMFAGTATPAGQQKAEFLGRVRQHLAELQDATAQTATTESEREELAEDVALELYQGRIDGVIDGDQLSTLLGEYLGKVGTKATKSGFVEKKDGSPGKTPAGYGKVLRDRINRIAAMNEYLDGTSDGGAFFKSMPDDARDEIESIRHRLDGGQIGFWQAYRELSEVKSDNTVRTKLAVDPRRISALADEIGEVEGTVKAWLADDDLVAAYAKLSRVLDVARQAVIAAAQ